MEISERIADHFAGIIHIKISHKEQIEHNKLVAKVKKATDYMLKREAIKINVEQDS